MGIAEALQIVSGITSPVAAAGFMWVAMELKYLRRDVEKAHDRLDAVKRDA